MCCKLTLCGLGSHFLNGGQGRGWWFCLVDLTTVNWNGAQVRKLDITVWKLEANVIPLVGVFHLCRRRRKFILEGIFHRSSVSQKHEASLKSHNSNVGKRFMYALFIFFPDYTALWKCEEKSRMLRSGKRREFQWWLFESDWVMKNVKLEYSKLSMHS